MRVFPSIDLTELCVSWDHVLSAHIGVIQLGLIEEMRRRNCDQAPVVTKDGHVVGLVALERLADLESKGAALVQDDSEITCNEIVSNPRLDTLLEVFAKQRAAIIVSHVSTEPGDHPLNLGFVTLSDLNKHPLRGVIYPLLAELEVGLAARINQLYANPWDWLAKLNKDKQARLVRYWEIAKRNNVDIGPMAGTMLTELLQIVGGTQELLDELGFISRKKWDDFVGKLPNLRNDVMHPVRPLLASSEDVSDLHEQLIRLLTLLRRLDEGATPGCQCSVIEEAVIHLPVGNMHP